MILPLLEMIVSLPKPSSSWSEPPTIINVEEQSTEDKKTIPCGMAMKPSVEERGEKLSECESNLIICFFNISLSVLDACFEYFFYQDELKRLKNIDQNMNCVKDICFQEYAPKKPK